MDGKAQSTVLIGNKRARVTEWRFAPGAATGWHHHAFDYVVVPLLDGRLKLVTKDGKESYADLKAGALYFRLLGVEHDVINDGTSEYAFIEVEMK